MKDGRMEGWKGGRVEDEKMRRQMTDDRRQTTDNMS